MQRELMLFLWFLHCNRSICSSKQGAKAHFFKEILHASSILPNSATNSSEENESRLRETLKGTTGLTLS